MSNILGEINYFLEKGFTNTLKITFRQLEIDTYHSGEFLKRIQKPNDRIIIRKLKTGSLAKMDVVDNIAFRFSFRFATPTSHLFYESEMQQLPRPLAQGSLEMNTEKLVLEFIIDALDKELLVKVRHSYTQILGLNEK
ncbi:hypothetical protein [Flagellimonas pacifica]|uniref:Uncharacterized protein n=1 Tax=Flagellimonas pacifica TaxID=1247520 RepID=A0A285MR85_9FLAO|nr:hypothetical protein [Allomuricauda parva]SNY99692.1 hypothetical protein SAMN06265377_1503 [Allomuricauda parva]